MSIKMNVPQLRFREFSGEWEEKKLIDTINTNVKWAFTGGPFGSDLKSDDYTDDGIRIIQLQNIGDGIFLNNYAIYTSKEKADILLSCNIYPSEIILSKMGDPVARACKMPNTDKRYLMASDGIRYVPDEEVYSKNFLFFIINHPIFRKKAITNSTGSTRKRIGLTQLKNINFYIPSKPEQEKIASFLSSVDSKIEQLSKKKRLLEAYKKGVMQKIFSQEIRFRDDDGGEYGEWVERKLGDLPIIISDGNYGEQYPTSTDFKSNGIAFLRANNIKNLKIDDTDTKYIGQEQHLILTSGHLKTNDILITTRGQLGNIALVDSRHNGSNINAQICLLRISDKNVLNHLYLLYILDYRDSKKQYKAFETGTALKQLPKGNLKKIKLKLPSLKEQTKIANFLSSIDSKIEQVSRELESTKQFKKALLQKMFV